MAVFSPQLSKMGFPDTKNKGATVSVSLLKKSIISSLTVADV